MSDTLDLRRSVEALILSSQEPATPAYLRRALPSLTPSRLPDLVEEINEELRRGERPYEIVEVSGGYQFRTLPEFAEVLQAAQPERKLRLSRAALETLAVVAYRQPVTRAEIEALRSVDCGAVLKGLLERNLVRIVGRRDAAPVGTSKLIPLRGLIDRNEQRSDERKAGVHHLASKTSMGDDVPSVRLS